MNIRHIAVVTDLEDSQGNITNGVRVWKAFVREGLDAWIVPHSEVETGGAEGADLILMMGTVLYPQNVQQAAVLAARKESQTILALWYFDACNPAFEHSREKYESMQRIVPSLDWLFMTDHSYPWENKVRRFGHLMQGVDTREFSGEPDWNAERPIDVIFTGGTKGAFSYRGDQVREIASRFSVSVYGRNSGRRVYGEDFINAYRKAKIALVPAPPDVVAREYWSNRIYLAAATGTPCVVGYVPGIESHYTDGREVLYYLDSREMMAAIQTLLSSETRRIEMGRAARERTLREHSYQARVQTMIEMIERDK